jgi:hypothetical protein
MLFSFSGLSCPLLTEETFLSRAFCDPLEREDLRRFPEVQVDLLYDSWVMVDELSLDPCELVVMAERSDNLEDRAALLTP